MCSLTPFLTPMKLLFVQFMAKKKVFTSSSDLKVA